MRAIVLFSEECTSIWAPLLKRDCRHVCICLEYPWGWRLESWDRGRLKVYDGPLHEIGRLMAKLAELYRVVRVEIPAPDNRSEFYSCTFHVKHRLNIKGWGLLTPYALYKRIA